MPENQQKPLILLATDSANGARLVTRHLEQYFRILVSEDAESAWESMVQQNDVSLLICNLALAIDRFGLLERLRNAGDSWLAATPVLLLVGENDTDAAREAAFQMGATDFINLPFASAELKARARLHANLYLQHASESVDEVSQVPAANLLQQLSQHNFFNSRVQQEMSFSLRHRSSFSLCRFKIDNIKKIVASFDKSTAFTVVNATARFVQQTLRREDTLCYLGNAEFCILYPATNGIGATTGVRRILANIEKRKTRIGGKSIPVTLSAVVYSCVATESHSLEDINSQLDVGLKQAIEQGGNRVVSIASGTEQRPYSIDRALKMLETGNTEELAGQAPALLYRILPLIDFGDDRLQLGLEPLRQQLRAQLESVDQTGTE